MDAAYTSNVREPKPLSDKTSPKDLWVRARDCKSIGNQQKEGERVPEA